MSRWMYSPRREAKTLAAEAVFVQRAVDYMVAGLHPAVAVVMAGDEAVEKRLSEALSGSSAAVSP